MTAHSLDLCLPAQFGDEGRVAHLSVTELELGFVPTPEQRLRAEVGKANARSRGELL